MNGYPFCLPLCFIHATPYISLLLSLLSLHVLLSLLLALLVLLSLLLLLLELVVVVLEYFFLNYQNNVLDVMEKFN